VERTGHQRRAIISNRAGPPFTKTLYGKMTSRYFLPIVFGFFGLVASCVSFSEDDRPALHIAAERNDIAFIQQWIKNGGNVDYEYNDRRLRIHGSGVRGQTALMVAAARRNLETVKLLVEAGANIYLESKRDDGYGEGTTVFDYAVEGGDVRIISYLWNASDKKRMLKHLPTNFLRAFDHACYDFPRTGKRELVIFFLDSFDRNSASEALWRISDRQACIPEIRFILDQGIPPASSALVTAASLGLTEIVALYLQRGANVNAYGRSSYTYLQANVTSLIASAGKVKLETMRFLLKEGANPDLQDNDGRTPLIAIISESACFRVAPGCDNQIEGIKLLLGHGARIDIADRQQKTAADYIERYRTDPYAEQKRALLLGQKR